MVGWKMERKRVGGLKNSDHVFVPLKVDLFTVNYADAKISFSDF
jgi:hypothetical protein